MLLGVDDNFCVNKLTFPSTHRIDVLPRKVLPPAGTEGLLCVRDFIARNAMIDVGDAGIDLIVKGCAPLRAACRDDA